MKKYITNTMRALLLVPVLALSVSAFVPAVAGATDLTIRGGATSAQGTDQEGTAGCLFGTEEGCSGDGIFKTITNVLLFIIGAISVIMLIIGGIRYTISSGDSAAVTSAKNTILYAIVGIIVALLSYAIVNFVLGSFFD